MEKITAYAITIKRADGKYEQDIILSDEVNEEALEKKAIDNDCTILLHEIGEVSLNGWINGAEPFENVKIFNGKGENNDKL